MNKLEKLYTELREKHGTPKGHWGLWCKRKKTDAEREEVMIGAILTQNTNWGNVRLAMANLSGENACSLKAIRKLAIKNIDGLQTLIRPAGFFRQKAGYLAVLAEFCEKKHGGVNNMLKADPLVIRNELLSLKGIGPETADSILLYALHKPVFVIDEYTRRLVKKRRLAKDISYEKLRALFEKNIKKDYRLYQDFHALIVVEGKKKNAKCKYQRSK